MDLEIDSDAVNAHATTVLRTVDQIPTAQLGDVTDSDSDACNGSITEFDRWRTSESASSREEITESSTAAAQAVQTYVNSDTNVATAAQGAR